MHHKLKSPQAGPWTELSSYNDLKLIKSGKVRERNDKQHDIYNLHKMSYDNMGSLVISLK